MRFGKSAEEKEAEQQQRRKKYVDDLITGRPSQVVAIFRADGKIVRSVNDFVRRMNEEKYRAIFIAANSRLGIFTILLERLER